MVWFLGFLSGAATVGVIWTACGMQRDNDAHARYVRERQRAEYAWRHPRAARRMKRRSAVRLFVRTKRREAPMPLDI